MKYEILSKRYVMKSACYFLFVLLCLASACHRRSVASGSKNNNQLTPLLNGSEATGEPVVTAPIVTRPIIIVDAKGNFAVAEKTLPEDASKEILDPANARAYTPAQTKTLAYRFGKVPPRILYVPPSLAKHSGKGTYYVLDKKFWYWKKSNGYFYIDENYFR